MKNLFRYLLVVCLLIAGRAEAEPDAMDVLNKDPKKMIELIGEPAARYFDSTGEYWLYTSCSRTTDNRRLYPEFRISKGKSTQINWLPEDVMKKSVQVAKGFAGWKPPAEIKQKTYTMADSAVMGANKSFVLAKLGSPDFKRVFNGIEVWEYKKVPLNKTDAQLLTVFLEFDGDRVSKSMGN